MKLPKKLRKMSQELSVDDNTLLVALMMRGYESVVADIRATSQVEVARALRKLHATYNEWAGYPKPKPAPKHPSMGQKGGGFGHMQNAFRKAGLA